jgi:hypothetical protein
MSQSPESLPPKLANAPFDDPRADLVLHSSDGVNFRVFKLILSLASTVFADMFTLPSPPTSQNSSDEPQVVPLPEDAETLDMALRYFYPVLLPEVVTLREARILLEFARKYQVDVIKNSVIRFLTDTIECDPVGIYALASTYDCQDLVAMALQSSPIVPIYLLHSPELQRSTTREQYEALIQYHISCGRVASAVSMRRKWIPGRGKLTTTSPNGHDFGCSVCIMPDFVQPDSRSTARYGPRYLWNYLHRSALVLAYHPNADEVTAEAFVLEDMKCDHCIANKRLEMLECSHAFAAEIRRVIKQVGSQLSKFLLTLLNNAQFATWQVPLLPLPTVDVEGDGNINDIVLTLLSESDKLDRPPKIRPWIRN